MVSRRALGTGPWVAQLCAFSVNVEDGSQELRDEDTIEAEVQTRLSAMLNDRQKLPESGPSGKQTLPLFYKKQPKGGTPAAEVSKEAQLRFLQLRHEMLLDNNELESLWFVLRQYAGAEDEPDDGAGQSENERVDYDRYCQISVRCAELFQEKSLPFFTPSTFLKFKRDSQGRISILSLFHYIMRKVSMQQTRIYLSYHDTHGGGHLLEGDLGAYVEQMMGSLPPLANLDTSMREQYKRIAVRKLMFFNDPHRLGRVKISDLLVSQQLSEFLELRHEVNPQEKTLGSNWFSLANAERVRNLFLDLDKDMDSLLSSHEFAAFGNGTLTEYFIQAVFQEHVSTWHARRERAAMVGRKRPKPTHMNFECFLEFLLAWENKKHAVSVAYFWRAFDRDHKSYLSSRDLYIFFRYVHQKWIDGGNYELAIDDVKDEIYDMVSPDNHMKMTLKDVQKSNMGETLVQILSDLNGFWQYDSREMLMQQAEQEEDNF